MAGQPVLLQRAIQQGITNPPGKSPDHGEGHWKTVALMGFWLARFGPVPGISPVPSASMEFVFTFALLHDLMRENEYDDPGHGVRASMLFAKLVGGPGVGAFPPYAQHTTDMMYALANHVGTDRPEGESASNVNVGLCWDADRLTLYRVGKVPDDRYLTTEAARTERARDAGRHLAAQTWSVLPSWAQIRREMELWRP